MLHESATSVVEDLNIFEDGLAGGFTGRIESPVYDFFLEDGEEAFAPRIVSRSADIREALFPTVIRYLCHHVIGVASIAAKHI